MVLENFYKKEVNKDCAQHENNNLPPQSTK